MRKTEILPELAAHGPKCAFCALFKELTLFSRFVDDLGSTRILRSVERKSEILPKLAPPGPKRALCALFIEIALFSRFGDDLRPVRGF